MIFLDTLREEILAERKFCQITFPSNIHISNTAKFSSLKVEHKPFFYKHNGYNYQKNKQIFKHSPEPEKLLQ